MHIQKYTDLFHKTCRSKKKTRLMVDTCTCLMKSLIYDLRFINKLNFKKNYPLSVIGQYFEAAEHFENYYKLAVEHKEWIQADGLTYHTDACINLSRIYTTIGQRMEEEDQQNSLEYLKKAHKFATESKDDYVSLFITIFLKIITG